MRRNFCESNGCSFSIPKNPALGYRQMLRGGRLCTGVPLLRNQMPAANASGLHMASGPATVERWTGYMLLAGQNRLVGSQLKPEARPRDLPTAQAANRPQNVCSSTCAQR